METNPTPKLSDREIISSVEMNNPQTSRLSFDRYATELIMHNQEAASLYLKKLEGATTTEEELRALAYFVIKAEEKIEDIDREMVDEYTDLLVNAYGQLCDDYVSKLHPPHPEGKRITLMYKEALADFMFSYQAVLLLSSTPSIYDKKTKQISTMQEWEDLTSYVTPLNSSVESITEARKIHDQTLLPNLNQSLDNYVLDTYFQDKRHALLTDKIEARMQAGMLDFDNLFYLGVEQRIIDRSEDAAEASVLRRVAEVKRYQPHVYEEAREIYQNVLQQDPELDLASALRIVAYVDLYHKIASECL